MARQVALVCSRCAAPEDAAAWRWRCARCGAPLDFAREPVLDELVSLGELPTPLVEVAVDGRRVLAKLEGTLPSGSFKDRGTRTVVSALRADRRGHALTDSSGNAGASLAAYCARAGIACDVYVPADTAPAKLAQVEAYGGRPFRVKGSRSDVADAAAAAGARGEGTYVPHGWTPWFLLGTSGFAGELVAQLGSAPDAIVLPVGSGTLLLGVARGFTRLERVGQVARAPRLYAVQPAACAPLVQAFEQGLAGPVALEPGTTAADGIRVGRPPRGVQILAAVRASGGAVVSVEDVELWAAFDALARQGILAEPTSAVAFAALRRLPLHVGETIVVPVTATGLKTIDAIARRPGS